MVCILYQLHLSYFFTIIPCGIDDKAVNFATGRTQQKKVPLDEVKEKSKTPSLERFWDGFYYNFHEKRTIDFHPGHRGLNLLLQKGERNRDRMGLSILINLNLIELKTVMIHSKG